MSTDWRSVAALFVWMSAGGAGPLLGQSTDLTKLSIEDLLNTEITSVSLKEQTLSRTAAAVHVITREDIRRSGAKTLPDLLRMAPGFAVGQIDASTWAVTSRGFNGVYANKVLVLVDGRSVYSPLFGGVQWDMQNMPLDEIEQVEVIRGPGGSFWGVNAVNGVINIITRRADTTQGGKVAVSASQAQGTAEMRYGGRIGDEAYYRVYGKYLARGSDGAVGGFDRPDAGNVAVGGFRLDWLGDIDKVSLNGSVQHGSGQHVRRRSVLAAPWSTIAQVDTDFADGSVVFSWTRALSSRSEFGVQTSYQAYGRTASELREQWHILEVDARQRQAIGRRHEINAGIGYRFWSATLRNTPTIGFYPEQEHAHLVTGFVQDEIRLTKRLHVTAGSKFEHDEFTGFAAQPSVRMTWVPQAQHALWAAASRPVRTPSMSDRGIKVTASLSPRANGGLMLITVEGNPEQKPERVRSLEAGYRFQAGRFAFDATAFQNEYRDLQSAEPGSPRPSVYLGRPVLHLPIQFANLLKASAAGAEVTASWQPVDQWRLSGSYSSLRLRVTALPGSRDTGTPEDAGSAPEQQFSLRTYVDLPRNVIASVMLYRVGSLRAFDVPAYSKLDVRLGWTARDVELAVGGQNLLHRGNHVEMVETTGVLSGPLRRSGYFEARWRF